MLNNPNACNCSFKVQDYVKKVLIGVYFCYTFLFLKLLGYSLFFFYPSICFTAPFSLSNSFVFLSFSLLFYFVTLVSICLLHLFLHAVILPFSPFTFFFFSSASSYSLTRLSYLTRVPGREAHTLDRWQQNIRFLKQDHTQPAFLNWYCTNGIDKTFCILPPPAAPPSPGSPDGILALCFFN